MEGDIDPEEEANDEVVAFAMCSDPRLSGLEPYLLKVARFLVVVPVQDCYAKKRKSIDRGAKRFTL